MIKDLHEIAGIYRNIATSANEKLRLARRRIYRVGTLRLVLFAGGTAGIIYGWQYGWLVMIPVAAAAFIPFLMLVKVHNRLFYQKEYLEKKIEVNEQEMQALNHDFSSFDNGEEFIDPEHLYSFDLDVFGSRSLFQLINRTSSEPGKRLLADWFNRPLADRASIEQRQKAVGELSGLLRFRQKFRILGLLYKGKIADEKEIGEWLESPPYFRNKPLMRLLPALALSVNVALPVLAICDVLSFKIWGMVFIFLLIVSAGFSRQIGKIQAMYGKKLRILGTYAELVRLIEDEDFRTDDLKEIKALVGSDRKTASCLIKRLSKLMNGLDQRNNMLVSSVLNGLFFWELRQIMRIESWKESCKDELPRWLEAIKRTDALCSMATFAYNNPDYMFPVIDDRQFRLSAKAMGHPLMSREKCVRNDVNITKRPYFIIITGANMAGKSTYLRTAGVNHLLACMGMPVFAEAMTVYPARLVTSLRTNDSLNDNESYFFAELKRLKCIIDMLARGEELFIILDEILKGTNSTDKQKGSIALISQLLALNTNGIIATHDLLLGKLIDRFPDSISNYRFEAEIRDNELSFPYKMMEGVAQNMNACFLMKKMGIAIIDDYPHDS